MKAVLRRIAVRSSVVGARLAAGKMNGWVASQVRYLMDQLAGHDACGHAPRSDHHLLVQSSWGRRCATFALPNIILGGTGGHFRTGQALTLGATSPTKVLISLANSMGVELAALGSGPLRDTEPLSGITA